METLKTEQNVRNAEQAEREKANDAAYIEKMQVTRDKVIQQFRIRAEASKKDIQFDNKGNRYVKLRKYLGVKMQSPYSSEFYIDEFMKFFSEYEMVNVSHGISPSYERAYTVWMKLKDEAK